MKLASLIAAMMAAPLLTSAAHAQFKIQEPQPLADWTGLECAIVEITEVDHKDPVYKIEVSVTLDDSDHHLKQLYVAHTHVGGKMSVRSEQYEEARIWQTPGKTDWFWTGKRGHGTMLGEVWRTPDMRWFYVEQFMNGSGRVEFGMKAECHRVDSFAEPHHVENDVPVAHEETQRDPTMTDAPNWLKSGQRRLRR